MATLGTITDLPTQDEESPRPIVAITKYTINRGFPLGAIVVTSADAHQEPTVTPLENYIVRQTRILYRQLWPWHGQRFPQ